ncbi:plasmodesmata-located protein 8-like [Juglans microcarpa x Juglans regia]|uniref:plasmodesmata-located protein 8-like n=1 Tax=Juglans microcarpa x Juglans regia TaxID=2249226 RepID=UPI001B7E7637|nr:plasmodesmata-located protein 8-like [Juglans microcarpa x Juglans regia]
MKASQLGHILVKKQEKKMLRNLELHFSTRQTMILVMRLVSSLFFSLLSSLSSHGYPINTFIYAGCSQEKYQPNSPVEGNLNSFLTSAVSSSSQVSYNSFAAGNGSSTTPDDSTINGLYQCRGDLKIFDCSKCIESAASQIALVCPYSYGASLQLEGCYIRYEHVDFLGKLDTSLRHTKCSKSVSNDVEFYRRRDGVLADLLGAIGFRVSSSGLVQGFAQCVGDLNPTDCSSCLADAVGKLKNVCGSATAADVYLAQCYARYWASGYYDTSSDSSNEDQVGKTVAIIVGILSGVALFIVLLSICRRTMG